MTAEDVLFVTTNDIDDPVRGCDRRSARLREHLGNSFELTSTSYRKSEQENRSTDAHNRSFPYPRSSLLAPFNPRVLYYIIEKCRQDEYDVVVASALGSILYGLVASALVGATFVLDLHNIDDQLSSEIGDYPRYIFAKVFTTIGLRRADIVVVTSEADKSSFDKIIQQKTIVVANGFDSDTFQLEDSDDQSPEDNRLLFFGNMAYEPNIEAVHVISETLSEEIDDRLPEYEIHIAGPDAYNI